MAAENGYTSQHGYELYDTTGTTEDWSYYATGGLGYTFEIGCDQRPTTCDLGTSTRRSRTWSPSTRARPRPPARAAATAPPTCIAQRTPTNAEAPLADQGQGPAGRDADR